MANVRARRQPWIELLTRPQPRGEIEWTVVCAHGEATSEDVRNHFSRDLILGYWIYLNATLPEETSEAVVQLVLVRSLCGRLLEERFGCTCGLLPYEIREQDAGGRQ